MKRIFSASTYSILLLLSTLCFSQKTPLNFHHLNVNSGLNDGIINAIAQDKFGHTWFASYGGLNRFNGRNIVKYTNQYADSTSIPSGTPFSMLCDQSGRLWIGYEDGLIEYDYKKDNFRKIGALKNKPINAVLDLGKNKLLVLTNKEVWVFHSAKNHLRKLAVFQQPDFFDKRPPGCFFRKNEKLFIGTQGGYIVYSITDKTATFTALSALKNATVDKIIVDEFDHVWVTNVFNFKLLRIDPTSKSVVEIDQLKEMKDSKVQMSFLNFVSDKQNVWIVTSLKGLAQYDLKTGKITFHQHNIYLPGSIASNILKTIYQSSDGIIWISLLGGIDYFIPDKNLFTIIYPFAEPGANTFARGFSEDRAGNYWFTTGDGISRYTPSTNTYKAWRNEAGKPDKIYYNSARAILADEEDNVWIATGKGVNKFIPATQEMKFLTAKDSLPNGFYLNINQDSNGNIWFCSNQNSGLYYFSKATKKIQSIGVHSVLKKYKSFEIRRVFEDSKHRLWIGFSRAGFALYDPSKGTTAHFTFSDKQSNSLLSNLIIDIKEDKEGYIWLSTFNGLRVIHPENFKSKWFTVKDGLKSNLTNGLAVDSLNRVWIGTSAGLMMLDAGRKHFTTFDESYGLPTSEFPEHQAHELKDGRFIFPSNKGYILFNPLDYREERQAIKAYVSSITVFDKLYATIGRLSDERRFELKPDENFVTFNLETVNYINPNNTWFAYKLEGLEEKWHYSQNPKAVYTNISGGSYTLRYKASTNPDLWSKEDETIEIHIDTYFYNTLWFRTLTALTLLLIGFIFVRYQADQKQKIHHLKLQSTRLKKDKTEIQYQNLINHLNPHFLFNSLTSLNSLILTEPKQASRFLQKLSLTYRYILQNKDKDVVPVEQELAFVKNYVDLQKSRFEEALQITIEVNSEFLLSSIVPVTLQNLFENAIKHNTIEDDKPLIINVFVEDGYLIVRNVLQRKKFVETSNKQGLDSLKKLYSYLTAKPFETIETETAFIVRVPLL